MNMRKLGVIDIEGQGMGAGGGDGGKIPEKEVICNWRGLG